MKVFKVAFAALAAVAILSVASVAQAATYSFNRSVGTGSVMGYFETDGTLGTLTLANFVDWSVTIQDASINGGVATTSSGAGGQGLFDDVSITTSLTATVTDILFDFDSSDLFYTYTASNDFWCVAGSGGGSGCFNDGAESIGFTPGFGAIGQAYSGVQSIASVAAIPLPAALPLLLVALGGLGFAGRRRKDA
jgi:hypothetical protein